MNEIQENTHTNKTRCPDISRTDVLTSIAFYGSLLTMLSLGGYLLAKGDINEKEYNHIRNVFYPALTLFIFSSVLTCVRGPKIYEGLGCGFFSKGCKKEEITQEETNLIENKNSLV